MNEFVKQLECYHLTTAKILYHMPDRPDLLQLFLWQELDVAPKFPTLGKFLHFWERELDGKLHSVTIAQRRLIKPSELKLYDYEFGLH